MTTKNEILMQSVKESVLTKNQAARALGIQPSTLARIESGETKIDNEDLDRFLKLLKEKGA